MSVKNDLEKKLPPVKKEDLWQLAVSLFPICRSITGNGVRQTLSLIQEHLPELQIHEVPSGTIAFDWTVPNEWNITDAFIKAPNGKRLVDFQKNNLHVMGYSLPFEGKLTLQELAPHLHSLPELPDAIPYVTSYYEPRWGFCLADNERKKLKNDVIYDVKIDSSLKPGALTYADILIPGKSKKEILISTYICHPSLANNELSGPVVATFLAKKLLEKKQDERFYSYRFVFVPETIGSICYLSQHYEMLKKNVIAGYVVTCVGNEHPFSYLESRQESSLTDRMTKHVLSSVGQPFAIYSYLERGSDERQYCSPGIDLPIGSLMRSKYGSYPEYHTSLDNLEFISAEALCGSLQMYLKCLEALDHNHIYRAIFPCEPQLGKRGLYPSLSTRDSAKNVRLMMNFLVYADGRRDLLAIAEKLNCSIFELIPIASLLHAEKVIEQV